jgi:hypothetical protein
LDRWKPRFTASEMEALRREAVEMWDRLSFEERIAGLLAVESWEDVEHVLAWAATHEERERLYEEAKRRIASASAG